MTTTTETQTFPRFEGAFTALITPFRRGEIDETALRGLIDFQIREGIDGIIPCGTTGESVTMTLAEHNRVIEITIDHAAGRVPVIAGTGTNNTAMTIEMTRHAESLGATAALIVVPYYNKPTQEGMYRHFAAIADATDLPLVPYNVPGRTAVNMTAETQLRLAEIPSIVAVKEASGDLDQASEIVLGAPEGFTVLSGDDSLTLPIMSVGGHGVVSVVSNIIPAEVAALTRAARAGDFLSARDMHQRMFNLCRAMFLDNNPTSVKTAAEMMGLCSGEVRQPLVPMSTAHRTVLEQTMREYGLLDTEVLAA